MNKANKHSKTLGLILSVMALVFMLAIYFGVMHHHKAKVDLATLKIDGTILDPARPLPPFTVQSSLGHDFTEKDLQGHWTILFFGFSNCGYVCPTTLAALNKTYGLLSAQMPKDRLPQILMISVDPDRDSVERMKAYVESFNPHFIGARAPLEAIMPLEQALGVVAVKMEASQNKNSNNYAVNHSAELFVVDEKGQVRAYLSYPHEAVSMAHDYTTLTDALGV